MWVYLVGWLGMCNVLWGGAVVCVCVCVCVLCVCVLCVCVCV